MSDEHEPDQHRPDEQKPDEQNRTTPEERAAAFTRRELLRAGWAVPLIISVIPPQASAEEAGRHTDRERHIDKSPHADGGSPHTDGPVHRDVTIHIDVHTDL